MPKTSPEPKAPKAKILGTTPKSFAQEVLGLLMPLGPVTARGMFGGHGFYLDGQIFAIAAWQQLWFKVDEESRPAFAAAGSRPFIYEGKTKPVEMPYMLAPEGSLKSPEVLLPWAQLALEASRRNPTKRKSRKKT